MGQMTYHTATEEKFRQICELIPEDWKPAPVGINTVRFEMEGEVFVMTHEQARVFFTKLDDKYDRGYSEGWWDGYDNACLRDFWPSEE